MVVTITMLAPAHCFTVDSRYVLSSALLSLCRVELETKVVKDYAKFYKGPSTQVTSADDVVCQIYLNQKVMKSSNSRLKLVPLIFRLVLEVGGPSTLQAAMPRKLKSTPLQSSKKGGLQLSRHGCLQSWSPPHLKSGGFTLAWPSCTWWPRWLGRWWSIKKL